MSIIRFHTASDDRPNNYTVTAATAVDDSTEIDIRSFAGGGLSVPDGTSAATLSYYVATKPAGTFGPLQDRDNTAVEQTIEAGKCYPLPDEIYGFGALKIVADAEVNLTLSLKG